MFEPTMSSMTTHMISLAPMDKIVPKAIMKSAIVLLATVENELANQTSDIRVKKQQADYIESMIEDFAVSFEKRIMMMVINSFMLNCPIDVINGNWLKKLIDSKDAKTFDDQTVILQSVFKLKTDSPLHRIEEVFREYLVTFRDRFYNHQIPIEKLLMNFRATLEKEVLSNLINNDI